MNSLWPAIMSGGVAIAVSLIGIYAASKQQARKLRAEAEQQRDLLREQLRAEYAAEAVIRIMLTEGKKLRTFDAIKNRLGGFGEDELRKLLVQAGAVRFRRRRDGAELWGLARHEVDSSADAER